MRRRLTLFIIPGCLLLLCLSAVAAYFLYKTIVGDPPGVGPKAEQGYQACAPIIQALASYQAQQGSYPTALAGLVPAYLNQVPAEVTGQPLGYMLKGASYQLEFRYVGPGMNICDYSPETGWKCHGYY